MKGISVDFMRGLCTLIVFVLSNSHMLYGQVTEVNKLQKEASIAYYMVQPAAIRSFNGADQFLFISQNPSSQSDILGTVSSSLVLASCNNGGKISVVWQYDLPENGSQPIWLNLQTDVNKSTILISLADNECLVFNAPSNDDPVLTNKFTLKFFDEDLDLNPGHYFLSRMEKNQLPSVFYSSRKGLLILDVNQKKPQTLWSMLGAQYNAARFMAAQDLDGDGTLDIIASTASNMQFNSNETPAILHVWHFRDNTFDSIYTSQPLNHWSLESKTFSTGKRKPKLIASYESRLLFGTKYADTIYLYRWNGLSLQTITSSETAAPSMLRAGWATVDLDGDGSDEIVAFVSPDGRNRHLVVLKLIGQKLVREWESPSLDPGLEFGRSQDYEKTGRQQLPLYLAQKSKIVLFKQVKGKFTGFEEVLNPVLPPLPPKPLGERLTWQQEDGIKPDYVARNFLVLDGSHLILVPANDREINALYRTQQVMGHILDLAKQKFPPAKIVSRKVGDEDEEPKMEVAAGKVVIITLTESEAKAQGKTLSDYAQEWVSAVKTALFTLAKPPK